MNFIQDNKVWRWFAQRNLPHNSIDLFLMAESVSGGKLFKRKVSYTEISYESSQTDVVDELPSMRLHPDEARMLMDAMWAEGVRPTKVGDEQARIEQYQSEVKFLRTVIYTLLNETQQTHQVSLSTDTLEMIKGG